MIFALSGIAGSALKSIIASKAADKASDSSEDSDSKKSEGSKAASSSGESGMNRANTALALGQTVYDAIKGRQAEREAEAVSPALEDPETREFAEEMDRKRRSLETGAAFETGERKIRQMTADTQSSIVDATSGDVSSTLTGLLQSQRQGGRQMNEVLARGFNRQKYFTNLYNKLNQRLQQRELEMKQLDETQALAEAAQRKKQARANLNALIAQAPDETNEERFEKKGGSEGSESGMFVDRGSSGGGSGGGSGSSGASGGSGGASGVDVKSMMQERMSGLGRSGSGM